MNSNAKMQPLPDSAASSGRTVMGRWIVMLAALGLLSACVGDKAPEEPVRADQAAPPPQEVLPSDYSGDAGGDVSISERTVYFAFDDYALNAQAQASMDEISNYMNSNSGVRVKLEGHCDERGSTEYNLALGQRRAQAVKDYLVQLGIDENRLPTISYGEEAPAVEGSNEAAWSQNRRVEFVLQNE